MTDKETLILAAKAMGLDLIFWADNSAYRGPPHKRWNPLTSNDDCFRLETALGLDIQWDDERGKVHIIDHVKPSWTTEYYIDHNGDKDKARRYASTRAAALRGRE